MLPILLFIGLYKFGQPVYAQEDAETAREHYQRGSRLFDLQRYIEAAHEFEEAYQAKDDPVLLYNIAQAYRLGGQPQAALGAYRSYLRRKPDAPNRKAVQDRIRELSALVEAQRLTAEKAPTGVLPAPTAPPAASGAARPQVLGGSPPPVQAKRPTASRPTAPAAAPPAPARLEAPAPPYQPAIDVKLAAGSRPTPRLALRVAGIVAAAVGVGAVGAGAGLGIQARRISDQISHPSGDTTFDPALEARGKIYNAAAIGLLAGGGVAAAGGVVMAVLGWRGGRSERASSMSFTPVIGAQSVGAVFHWRF